MAKKRKTKKKNQRTLSIGVILLLFIGSIFLGTGIFLIAHPLDQYAFHNPFANLKNLFQKKIHLPTLPTKHSINYAEYQTLYHHISIDNKTAIETFLKENPDSLLSSSLRNKWLLFLAEQQDWQNFLLDYRPTNNQAVECYYLRALYRSGQKNLALSGVKRLWLAGYKPSQACTAIFSAWQNSSDFKEEYLWSRLQMAIDQNDMDSLRQLTPMLPTAKQPLVKTWIAIRKNPTLLLKTQLPNNAIGYRIVIDGLKQWSITDVDKTIQYWNTAQKVYYFPESFIQDFYLTASLHLALRGDPQAEPWFAKILPQYSTPESRAWQVRFALIHQNWSAVLTKINAMPTDEQKSNSWQYWKARALSATGNQSAANTIYAHLSSQRQYYGFLAAYQQKKALSIQQQTYPQNDSLLTPYKQQINEINQLYHSNKNSQALQLTEDLLNQLNQTGRYTLANLFKQWGWYSESMTITNRSPYQNDLKLRFPLPHRALITEQCSQVNVSPALVYAIARQESNFHEDVFSSAGGLGILQLTLLTAKQFDPMLTKETLYNPEVNIRISIAYLKKLTRQFNEHPLLIASAYNAGPQKTRSWQPTKAPIPADIWIETRPWGETRNYMKNILSYYAVYQYLLGQTPNIAPFMKDIPKNQ